jgi:hypothetical protein
VSLLTEFRDMLDNRRDAFQELKARIEANTAKIEQLLGENRASAEACTTLGEEIEFLEVEIARLTEHEPVPEAPMPDPTETRREAEELVRERRAAEEQAKQRRRKPKPDPVKAAKKEAKRREEEEAAKAKAAAQSESKPKHAPRYRKDPLQVMQKRAGSGTGKKMAEGIKRTRLTDLHPEDIDLKQYTPTDMERADLFYEMLDSMGGVANQVQLAEEWCGLLNLNATTAQAHTSRLLRVLVGQRRVVYTGEKVAIKPGGRIDIAVWKTYEKATPPERAAAGMGLDEDYAGTTTRWPNAATTPGLGRVTVEPSAFEQGKGS